MEIFVRPTVSECPYNMTVGLMVRNAPWSTCSYYQYGMEQYYVYATFIRM